MYRSAIFVVLQLLLAVSYYYATTSTTTTTTRSAAVAVVNAFQIHTTSSVRRISSHTSTVVNRHLWSSSFRQDSNTLSPSATTKITTTFTRRRRSSSRLRLVTEGDVMDAVARAEALWAEALEARKTANALSDRAEEEAEAAAATTLRVDEWMKTSRSISLEKIARADAAAKTNIDANATVQKALEAVERADQLEQRAEEALQTSEQYLEQHLLDFPNSSLAE